MEGLSPRERGNRDHGHARLAGRGSIPARAGEPSEAAWSGRQDRVYPRASGGTMKAYDYADFSGGLSPRERGNHISMKF